MPWLLALLGFVVWMGLHPLGAQAQRSGHTPEQLEGVGVDQKPGTEVPTELTFRDEQGEPVTLGQYFDGSTPVMMTFNYHRCPMLCQIQLQKFAETISEMSWTAGEEFEVVTVDIDPDEGPEIAREAQERYRSVLKQPEKTLDGWHFLTGDQASIDALTEAVGFKYKLMEKGDQKYAHPAAIVFTSGEGTVSRYFTTLDPSPGNVRTALVDASNGEVGNIVDKAFLACARFNPDSNSYSASAFKVMQYGSVVIVLLLGTALFVFWRREKEKLEAAEEDGFEAVFEEEWTARQS